ncbi:hypothetical protein BCR32DRAFT_295359 [Anaeromyces robustus]|jgi:hypothetical protein|uniref:Agd3 CBM87 domain-containing protein n=1 Tax=Anaeromyces robustus TaxID=1754192 RepID=A0A1Y1WXJ2_9FUNG|nr:hypothetical protein BCR32DRAFT_295359 [Anaeromyces robustus]|eukprot:ORX77844.1 hypothetical protein BCR32DRAFT_295359 [Anaeromyces robustus]
MRFNFKKIAVALLPFLSFAAAEERDDPSSEIVLFVNKDANEKDISSTLMIFEEYQIPYTLKEFSKDGYTGNFDFLYKDGQPRFHALVFPNGRVAYKGNEAWKSSLTDEQWAQLEDYAKQSEARIVYLNEYPHELTCTQVYHSYGETNPNSFDDVQQVTAPASTSMAEEINGLNFDTKDIHHYPAEANPNTVNTCEVEPLLFFEKQLPNFPEQTWAAVTAKRDGLEMIAFYLAFGDWSKASTALNIIWLEWALGKNFKQIATTGDDTKSAFGKTSDANVSTAAGVILVTLSTLFTMIVTLF